LPVGESIRDDLRANTGCGLLGQVGVDLIFGHVVYREKDRRGKR
jgi:hypothetical protein